mgnify:CR=1 FL=1
MNWEISLCNRSDIPLDLLMEAESSEDIVKSYPAPSLYFSALKQESLVSVGVVNVDSNYKTEAELLNISTYPEYQGSGVGKALMNAIIQYLRKEGMELLKLGTGAFGYQLSFYQKLGFRVVEVEKDYFLRHYPEPLFENGIQHKDRLILELKLS